MSPRLKNTMGVALVGLLCLAPLGMAAGTAAGKTPGVSSAQRQPPRTMPTSVQGGDRMTATVEGVDQRKGTLKLRAADGNCLLDGEGVFAFFHVGFQILDFASLLLHEDMFDSV